jgi:microcystin-dependent protein
MAEAFIGEIRLFAFNYAPQDWMFCEGQTLTVQQYPALFSLLGNVYGGDGQVNFKLPDLRGRFPTHAGQGPLVNLNFGAVGGTGTTAVNTSSSFTITNPNQLPAHTHTATFTGTGGGTGATVQPTITIKVSNDTAVAAGNAGATPIAGGYIGKAATTVPAQPAIYAAGAASGTTTLNAATATATGGSYSSPGITGGTVSNAPTGASQPINVPLSFGVPAAMPPFLAMRYAICVNGLYPTHP